MRENTEFLKAFIKNPLNVGAIAPSSHKLAERMIEGINPDRNSIVMELGVGTGSFTKLLKEIVTDKKSYIGIEQDKNLVKFLRRNFPKMWFIQGSACKALTLHKLSKFGKVDYILSGLPFVSMPKEVSKKIFTQIEKFMDQGCMFRTFQYVHGYYLPPAINLRAFMSDRYGVCKRSPLILKNIPPAVTLTWKTN